MKREPESLEFEVALTCDPLSNYDTEPTDAHTNYSGEIRLMNGDDGDWDADRGEIAVIGRMKFAVVRFSTRWPPYDVFDCEQAMVPYIELLDPKEDYEELAPRVCKALKTTDPSLGPILVLDRLQILPEARGLGLGLKVTERIIDKFGVGCRFAVMKSYPLQLEVRKENPDEFERRMALDAIAGPPAVVHKRLARYYRRAGFRSIPGTDHLMIRSLEE